MYKIAVDHKGNKFKSKGEMCKYWGKSYDVVRNRLLVGWELKDALERQLSYNSKKRSLKDALEVNRDSSIEDHKGNEFKDIKDMCKYWGKDYELVSKRLRNGWGIEDALEKPAGKYYGYYKEVEDHKGNKFRCIADMCEYWGCHIVYIILEGNMDGA